ncbi:hypothetical protein WJX72_006493 [[Myrmecia] bisecta]|uniref:CUE domain-containing protein n=1 Tax=[Myrmecia] bisecta TaxID=41462 RepID=A0AAW1QR59_9CHLO
MSVAAQSPYERHKRLFDASSDGSSPSSCSTPKRLRHRGSPSARCRPLAERQAYVVSSTTLAALRGLFPEMDAKVVADVLDACGDNVDEAIKQLGQLRLTANCSVSAAAAPAADTATSSPSKQPASEQQAYANGHMEAPASSASEPSPAPKTSAEWVDALVQQMAGATSVDDARVRAAQVLQAFEQAVLQATGSVQDMASTRAQVQELQKDNSILKRAVQIQNSRMQELAGREQELAQLKQLVVQYQEKVHSLEVSNYSLAMHLRQATDARSTVHNQRDVF